MFRRQSCWLKRSRRLSNADYNLLWADGDLEQLDRDLNTVGSVLAVWETTLSDDDVWKVGTQQSAVLYFATVSWLEMGWRMTYRSKGSEGMARSMTA